MEKCFNVKKKMDRLSPISRYIGLRMDMVDGETAETCNRTWRPPDRLGFQYFRCTAVIWNTGSVLFILVWIKAVSS